MLDPQLRQYIAKGYVKLGDISYDIALNMRKGKNGTSSQRALYEKGIKMYLILDVLFRHVTFDDTTLAPILWRVTEDQVNSLMKCLVTLGQLNEVPIAPSLFPTLRPILITQGVQGPAGQAGVNGTDANINVVVANGEKQIKISQSVVAGVKTYSLSFVSYLAQLLSSSISGGTLFETGDKRDFDITISSTKGTEAITSITCTDTTLNTALQALVDLTQANGVTQPYNIVLHITNQTTNQTFTFNSVDGVTTDTSSCSIAFVYPFFYGHNSVTGVNPYSALTKSIATKSNKVINFNFVNEYAYFAYPASYGDLTSIKDQNGFDVTSSFTKTVSNVSSSGLYADWTISYNIYRTLIKTTINGNYTFNF